MVYSLRLPSSLEGEASPAPEKEIGHHSNPKIKKSGSISASSASEYTVLRNKPPQWHDLLHWWWLNFHGRVTVAPVENFQHVVTVNQCQPGHKGDQETVLLQFRKVGDDTFIMDLRQATVGISGFCHLPHHLRHENCLRVIYIYIYMYMVCLSYRRWMSGFVPLTRGRLPCCTATWHTAFFLRISDSVVSNFVVLLKVCLWIPISNFAQRWLDPTLKIDWIGDVSEIQIYPCIYLRSY